MTRVKKVPLQGQTVDEVSAPPEASRPEQPKKGFEPVVFASRGKALTLWVEGGKKKIQFNSNGIVGIFIAKSDIEVKEIEESRPFSNGEVWTVSGELKGSSKPIISGPRSSLTQPQPLPVDPEIAKIVAESNTAAQRPVSTE